MERRYRIADCALAVEEEERSVSKPIVKAAVIQAGSAVFDTAPTLKSSST